MPEPGGQPEPLSEDERKARREAMRKQMRSEALADLDWAEVQSALEALVDTGKRDPILALAQRLSPETYSEISGRVMVPRKEAKRQRQIEMVRRAQERKAETERQTMAASQRRARAHREELLSMVRSEIANLKAGGG